jgi:hypothetical protein
MAYFEASREIAAILVAGINRLYAVASHRHPRPKGLLATEGGPMPI